MLSTNQTNSQSRKNFRFILKSAAIALVLSLLSFVAISSGAYAGTIGCKEQFIKDFTVIPYFVNTTQNVIPS